MHAQQATSGPFGNKSSGQISFNPNGFLRYSNTSYCFSLLPSFLPSFLLPFISPSLLPVPSFSGCLQNVFLFAFQKIAYDFLNVLFLIFITLGFSDLCGSVFVCVFIWFSLILGNSLLYLFKYFFCLILFISSPSGPRGAWILESLIFFSYPLVFFAIFFSF